MAAFRAASIASSSRLVWVRVGSIGIGLLVGHGRRDPGQDRASSCSQSTVVAAATARRHSGSRSSRVDQRLGFSPTGNSRPTPRNWSCAVGVGDLVGEAEPAVRLGVEAVECLGGQEQLEPPARLRAARPAPGDGSRPADRGVGDRAGDRLLLDRRRRAPARARPPRSRRVEAVAEAGRAVDVAGVAGVDPDLDAVQPVGPVVGRRRAERRPVGLDGDGQAPGVPGDADVGPGRQAVERRRSWAGGTTAGRSSRRSRPPVRGRPSTRRQGMARRNQKAWGKSGVVMRGSLPRPSPPIASAVPRPTRWQRRVRGSSAIAAADLPSRLTISIAASAASAPLLPPFSPARLSACSTVSVVRMPKMTGTPVARPAWSTPAAAWPATWS